MRLQLKIFLKILKQNLLWILFGVILIGLGIIFIKVKPKEIKFNIENFLILIGYPNIKKISFVSSLLIIFQIIFINYLIYLYYSFEFDNSFENIILRINHKKWLINKLALIILFIFIIKLLEIFVIHLFFPTIHLKIDFIFIPILYCLSTNIIFITILNFLGYKNILSLIFILLVNYIVFNFFNIYIIAFAFIFLILINLKYFNFKIIYKNSYK